MSGPIGVNCRFRRRVSGGVSAAWVVLSIVLLVLTCLSMNPFDLE